MPVYAVVEADEAVHYVTEFLNFLDLPDAIARTAIENHRANYHVAKYQLAKTLQRHTAYCKKIIE